MISVEIWKWKKDLGIVDISKYGTGWGYASSPAIHDGRIVLVCDDPKNPYIVSLNLDDGEEVWRKSRTGRLRTKLGHSADLLGRRDSAQVVVNGWPWIVAYDLATGSRNLASAGWRRQPGSDSFHCQRSDHCPDQLSRS